MSSQRNKRMATPRAAVVRRGSRSTVGLLYFQTDDYVVLLNNVAGDAELGPLRSRRNIHLEPEANITIIPMESDMSVEEGTLKLGTVGQRR